MVRELNKTTTLTGTSNKQYRFELWGFDDFDDVKNTFTGGGLYLFTNRYKDGDVYRHSYLYLGETGDYYTRYNSHHKEFCIRDNNANCIGFYSMPNATEEERKTAENDILSNYNFPCNVDNN